jgi:hypothetical protein
MTLKGLFDSVGITHTLADKTPAEIGDAVESVRYHSADIIRDKRFIPPFDFSDPANFAKYGSAEEYYRDAWTYIQDSYPYDGSLAEKVEWENSGSYIDLHIFDKQYPRSTGYVLLCADGWGTGTDPALTDGYGLPVDLEYIYIRGGPNTGSTTPQVQSSNVWDVSNARESNLKFDLQNSGSSIEFWLKKEAFDPSLTHKEVIFDLWNNEADTSADYGRVTLELSASGDDGAGSGGADPFLLTVLSGTAGATGFTQVSLGPSTVTTSSVADNTWNHYAVTMKQPTVEEKAIQFVGSGKQYIESAPTSPDWNDLIGGTGAAGRPFAAAVWVYIDGDTSAATARIWNFHYGRTLSFDTGAGLDFTFRINGDTGPNVDLDTAGAYPMDRWHHVVVTYSGMSTHGDGNGTMKIYVNGVEDSAVATSQTDPDICSDLQIGGWVHMGVNFLDGYVSSMGVWTGALTDTEIATLYNNGQTPLNQISDTSMAAWFRMGDDIGDSLDGTNTPSVTNNIVNQIQGGPTAFGNSFTTPLPATQIVDYSPVNTSVQIKFYVNGDLSNTLLQPTGLLVGSVGDMGSPQIATIGSLITNPSASSAAAYAGKLSASLDEFRYWKTQRTSRDVGRYWLSQVGGGSNTDTANTDLGVYYKFNEGITADDTIDATVLDYSGRLSNGHWIGYESNSRNTGSAIVSASAAGFEFADPILYSVHPEVSASLTSLLLSGSVHDFQNPQQLFSFFPSWMQLDDPANGNELKKLSQIISSYFDTLQLQIEAFGGIEDARYVSGSTKPTTLGSRLLASRGLLAPDLFLDADVLEKLGDRSEDILYHESLTDVKNTIYQNIYTNLLNIFKTKGTQKSFRNLLRCFGVDDEIYRINMYANRASYDLEDNRELNSIKKKFVDFNHRQRFGGTVFLSASNNNIPNYSIPIAQSRGAARSYLSIPTQITGGFATTLETYIFFPQKPSPAEESFNHYNYRYLSSSLFGCHTVDPLDPDTLTWDPSDPMNYNVCAVRDQINSTDVRFVFSSTSPWLPTELTTSYFDEVYTNTNWGFAVTVKPVDYPFKDYVSGSSFSTGSTAYILEFKGTRVDSGEEISSFILTASLSTDVRPASAYLGLPVFRTASLRPFVGSHYDSGLNSIITRSDVKAGFMRYWLADVSRQMLKNHILDVTSYGASNPSKSPFLFQASSSYPFPFPPHVGPNPWTGELPVEFQELDTLALNWDFETVTGSGYFGTFAVPDFSSGSATAESQQYGPFGTLLGPQHPGYGYGFTAIGPITEVEARNTIDSNYVLAAEKSPFEILNSMNMISVVDTDEDVMFIRTSRPLNHQFIIEKSMYRTISDSMLQMFASIEDFNNLVGAAANKYRSRYKQLSFMRRKFFEKVQNSPDFDHYYEFYKWFDSSLSKILAQLIPAGALFDDEIRNVIENHVLERSKYEHKLAGFEPIEGEEWAQGVILSILPLSPGWQYTHAPLPVAGVAPQNQNANWWKTRASRDSGELASSDSVVNIDKDRQWRSSTEMDTLAKKEAPWRYDFKEIETTNAGLTLNVPKSLNYVFEATAPFGPIVTGTSASTNIMISYQKNVEELPDIIDELEPWKTGSLGFKLDPAVLKESQTVPTRGELLAPFSVYSSTVTTGYNKQISDSWAPSIALTHLHEDIVGPGLNTRPLQGPFTERHVGGRFYRHTRLNPGTDSRADRGEGFRLEFAGVLGEDNLSIGGDYLAVVPPNYPPEGASTGEFPEGYDANLPTAHRLRIEAAKSPVNIKYIRSTTGDLSLSPTNSLYQDRIGNYSDTFEILELSSRQNNDLFFINSVNNDTFTFASYPETSNRVLRGRYIMGTNLGNEGGTLNFELPQRTADEATPTVRFTGTGEKMQSSLGALDPPHEELSIYNCLNFWNLDLLNFGDTGSATVAADASLADVVRVIDQIDKNRGLRQRLQLHQGPFGSDAVYGSVSALSYVTVPSYHFVPPNRGVIIKEELDGSHHTGSSYDNGFVQEQIPKSPQNYMWISESIDPDATIFNWTVPHTSYYSASSWPLIEHPDDYSNQTFNNLVVRLIDPVDAESATMGFPLTDDALSSYSNPDYWGSWGRGMDYFNLLMLKRNGPYQYPTWQQIRNGYHPVIKQQIKENIIQIVTRTAADDTIAATTNKTVAGNGIASFVEPWIATENNPIVHTITKVPLVAKIRGAAFASGIRTTYEFESTLDNKLTHYANYQLDNMLGLQSFYDSSDLYFNRINSMILKERNKDAELASTLEDISVVYSQTVFPAPVNANLHGTYTRTQFNLDDIWNDSRPQRSQIPVDNGTTTKTSQDCTVLRQSMWPLDAPEDFTTSTSPSGSGEYQNVNNRFDRYAGGDNICLGVEYNFLVPTGFDSTSTPVFGNTVLYNPTDPNDCDELYSVPHQTYEEYAKYMKYVGKEYALVPEFRISEHLQKFLETNKGQFVGTDNITDLLDLTGSAYENSSATEFFNDYATSDFLKLFNLVDTAYEGAQLVDGTTLSKTDFGLKVQAIIKPLPYRNFYPAEYIVNQLAPLMSSSVGPYVNKSSELAWRTLLEPWSALMLNSVKGGVGVGSFVLTGNDALGGGSSALADIDDHISTADDTFQGADSYNNFLNDVFLNHGSGSIFSASIDPDRNWYNPQRIPFEALYKMSEYFINTSITGSDLSAGGGSYANLSGWMYDTGMASASVKASTGGTHELNRLTWGGTQGPLYNLAIDQFLASSQAIFIDPSKRPVFFSNPSSRFDNDTIKEGDVLALRLSFNRTLNSAGGPDLETFQNYSSPWAYGMPMALGPAESLSKKEFIFSASYAPTNASYTYGASSVTIVATASYDTPALDDLLTSFDFIYERDLEGPLTSGPGYWFAQQISESFNLTNVVNRVIPGTNTVDKVWSISPKWEYPVFHFPCAATVGASAATPIDSGADSVVTTKGMWHQLGVNCTGSQGIFVEITTPTHCSSSVYGQIRNPKSLAQTVGFEQGIRKSIGNVREDLKISEAIVAVPFIVGKDGRRKFYKLPKSSVAGKKTTGYLRQYIFPPNFDWLQNPTVESISMYVFEFDITLNKKDLSDIAQNVLPRAFRDPTKTDVFKMAEPKEIVHPLHSTNLLNKSTRKLREDLRWLVFKVKQRGARNYTLKSMTGDHTLQGVPDNVSPTQFPYTYNWPYDWLSIVELIKIDEAVMYEAAESVERAPKIIADESDAKIETQLRTLPSGEITKTERPKTTDPRDASGLKISDSAPRKSGVRGTIKEDPADQREGGKDVALTSAAEQLYNITKLV